MMSDGIILGLKIAQQIGAVFKSKACFPNKYQSLQCKLQSRSLCIVQRVQFAENRISFKINLKTNQTLQPTRYVMDTVTSL
jgi:hypothetical protein